MCGIVMKFPEFYFIFLYCKDFYITRTCKLVLKYKDLRLEEKDLRSNDKDL